MDFEAQNPEGIHTIPGEWREAVAVSPLLRLPQMPRAIPPGSPTYGALVTPKEGTGGKDLQMFWPPLP